MTITQLRERLESLLSVREYLTARVQDGTITVAQAQAAGAMLSAQHWQEEAVLDSWVCVGHARVSSGWDLELRQIHDGELLKVTAELRPGRGAHFRHTGADE